MRTVECIQCGRVWEVPTAFAQMYIMQHQLPCRYCWGEEE